MTIDIATLQDPRDFVAAHGEYALVGLYFRIYWESLELGEKVLGKPVRMEFIEEYQSYQNWLGIAADLLPEWAIEMLADIDVMLEDGIGL